MAGALTQAWIEKRIKKVIDQHFQESKYVSDKEWLKTQRLHYLGGVLQTGLFLLPTEKYFELKQYCYDKYGYDPGGLSGQYTLEMLMEEQDAGTDEHI